MIPWTQPLVRAGIVLGLGFGGFADGIVLHQILGWHHLVCVTAHCQPTSIEHLQLQNKQDGFFHLAVWLITLAGTAMLFRAGHQAASVWTGRVLFGSMLAGWGLFNFVEGIIDHQILGIHHVLPGSEHQLFFDLLFLAIGVALFFLGAWFIRVPARRPAWGIDPKSQT
jgi:uncharacterized membrane protein